MAATSEKLYTLGLRCRPNSPFIQYLALKPHGGAPGEGTALFVSGLPLGTGEEALRELFESFGEVIQAVLHPLKVSALGGTPMTEEGCQEQGCGGQWGQGPRCNGSTGRGGRGRVASGRGPIAPGPGQGFLPRSTAAGVLPPPIPVCKGTYAVPVAQAAVGRMVNAVGRRHVAMAARAAGLAP